MMKKTLIFHLQPDGVFSIEVFTKMIESNLKVLSEIRFLVGTLVIYELISSIVLRQQPDKPT